MKKITARPLLTACVALLGGWVGVVGFAGIANAQAAVRSAPELKGILNWPGRKLALLSDTNGFRGHAREFILGEGEREEEIVVREVKRHSVVVGLSNPAQELELTFTESAEKSADVAPQKEAECSVQLQGAGPEVVLRIYQQLAGRTLLRASRVPAVPITIPMTTVNKKFELLRVLDRALAEQGISIEPHRDKFAIVALRPGDAERVKPELWDVVEGLGQAGSATTNRDQIIPAGMIVFLNTDMAQVLRIFEELLDRSIVRASTLPAPSIALRTETELTRTEAEYAFAAVLALNDLSIIPAGDKFLIVHVSVQADQIQTMLNRIKPPPASTNFNGKVSLNFAGTDLPEVARFYQELLGKPIEIDPSTPRPVLYLQSEKPLDTAAALYGIELLLGVNGLSVVPQETGDGMKIVPTAALSGRR